MSSINFRKPVCCGGESVAGDRGAGCGYDEEKLVWVCRCLKKATWNYPLVFCLLQEMFLAKLHLSNDILGEWTRFCVKQAQAGSKFSSFAVMNAHQLRKQFIIMQKDSTTRTAQGSSAGFESHKEVTPVDSLFMRMQEDIDRAKSKLRMEKARKEEVNSSKTYFEQQTLDSSDTSDSDDDSEDGKPHINPPKRNISMLQRPRDGKQKESGEKGELTDEDNQAGEVLGEHLDENGFTSITLANKPQNGEYLFDYYFYNNNA